MDLRHAHMKVQLKQCSQCSRANKGSEGRGVQGWTHRGVRKIWRNFHRRRRISQISRAHEWQREGTTASQCPQPGPLNYTAGFPRASVTPTDLELESLTQKLALGEEPTLVKCSFWEGRCASLHGPSQLASLQPCHGGVIILILDLWKLRLWDGNSFTQSDTANRAWCPDLYSLLHSSQFTHLLSFAGWQLVQVHTTTRNSSPGLSDYKVGALLKPGRDEQGQNPPLLLLPQCRKWALQKVQMFR